MSGNRSLLQRVLIILSGFAFLGTTVFFAASTFMNANRQPAAEAEADAAADAAAADNQEQLAAQESGYAAVLEREPENLAALEGLARTRIEMGKLEAALEPLQKLTEIEPENQGLWQAIAAIRIERGELEAALEPLDRLIELAPEDEEIKQLRAQVEQQIAAGGAEAAPDAASGEAPASSEEESPADESADTDADAAE